MELLNVFQIVQKTLAAQGFKLCEFTRNSVDYSHFVLGNELESRPVNASVSYTALYGNSIEVRKIAHSNAAKADTSYYIAITEWDRSSNKDLKKVKLMRAQTENTLVKKITKLSLEYKQYVRDKQIEEEVEKLLG